MPLVLGSCRVCGFFPPYKYEFTHNTKQILQLIEQIELSKKDDIGKIYKTEMLLVNRGYSNAKRFRSTIHELRKMIDDSSSDKIIVLEISSIKVLKNESTGMYYLYDNFVYMRDNINIGNDSNRRHIMKLFPSKDDIIKNTIDHKQDEKEIITDLDEIYNYFNGKKLKLVLVPHLNYKTEQGSFVKNRVMLCNILKTFSESHDRCYYFNPLEFIPNDNKEDMNHYNEHELKIIKTKLDELIKTFN